MMNNLVLIGMPGAGKSTIGVVLAKSLGMQFVDSDLVIQEQEGKLLQTIIDTDGMEPMLDAEERAVLSINGENSVIATGGSVVYREGAMRHLRTLGKVVYIEVPFDEIERRINNITTRGIAIRSGATLMDIYEERRVLYERYAHLTVDCNGRSLEEVVGVIMEQFSM